MPRGARGKIDSRKLLSLIDILDVVREVGNLKGMRPFRKNRKFWSLCPFHAERNPSFTVSPVMQCYHCCGCGIHGNAVNFIEEITGSANPVFDLAKLAVKKGWCTWRQVRGRSPSSIQHNEHIVPDYYVAPGYPSFYRDLPFPDYENRGCEDGSLE